MGYSIGEVAHGRVWIESKRLGHVAKRLTAFDYSSLALHKDRGEKAFSLSFPSFFPSSPSTASLYTLQDSTTFFPPFSPHSTLASPPTLTRFFAHLFAPPLSSPPACLWLPPDQLDPSANQRLDPATALIDPPPPPHVSQLSTPLASKQRE